MQEKDLIDFTPELNAEAREIFKQYRNGPLFTPPSVRTDTVLGTLQLPGNQGSALWQGAAWDPETNMLYVPSVSNMTVQALAAWRHALGHDVHRRRRRRWRSCARGRTWWRWRRRGGRAAGPAPQAGATSAGPAGPGGPQNAAPAACAQAAAGGGGRGGGGRGGGGRGGGGAAPPATSIPCRNSGAAALLRLSVPA